METVDDFLSHYGKKGMKWGVRRKNPGAVTGKQHKQIKKTKKKTAAKANAKSLSDAELKAAVNRMNLEKQYNQLIGAKKSKGKVVGDFVKGVGGTALKSAATALATQQVASALKKATTKAG